MQTQLKQNLDELDITRDYYIAYEYSEHINKDEYLKDKLLLTISGSNIQKCLPSVSNWPLQSSRDDLISTLEHEIFLLGRLDTGNMSVGSYNGKARLFGRKIIKGSKQFNRDFPLYLSLYLALKLDALLESNEGILLLTDNSEKGLDAHPMHHENAIVAAKVIANNIFRENRSRI